MFSASEKDALQVFRSYKIAAGELLCFSGPNLQKHEPALKKLAVRKILIKERFKGAYSLTAAGYEAMSDSNNQ